MGKTRYRAETKGCLQAQRGIRPAVSYASIMRALFESFPVLLFAAYVLELVALGIAPYDRNVWWAENIPIVVIAVTLAVLYARGVRASNLAYGLMSVLLFMHTVGGHYTFERVPFGWVTRAFGFHRNHYDRVAHFSVGFYAFGMAELLETRKLVARRWLACVFAICAIGTVAALYEIVEWIYAVTEGGSAGAAFLGSQGDIWDAQEDMLADILGAVSAIALYSSLASARRSRLEAVNTSA
jgi:putative membrane protein